MCWDSTSIPSQVSVVPSCPHKSGCVGTVLQLLTRSVLFHRVHTRAGVSGQYFTSANQFSVVPSCPHKSGCVRTVLHLLTRSVLFHRVHTRVDVLGQYFNS